ncbi:MAG: hypothetical protein MI748_09085 [Opitutales bacterium]|nr:hypothetical protein [Opitutales bacterium]
MNDPKQLRLICRKPVEEVLAWLDENASNGWLRDKFSQERILKVGGEKSNYGCFGCSSDKNRISAILYLHIDRNILRVANIDSRDERMKNISIEDYNVVLDSFIDDVVGDSNSHYQVDKKPKM